MSNIPQLSLGVRIVGVNWTSLRVRWGMFLSGGWEAPQADADIFVGELRVAHARITPPPRQAGFYLTDFYKAVDLTTPSNKVSAAVWVVSNIGPIQVPVSVLIIEVWDNSRIITRDVSPIFDPNQIPPFAPSKATSVVDLTSKSSAVSSVRWVNVS